MKSILFAGIAWVAISAPVIAGAENLCTGKTIPQIIAIGVQDPVAASEDADNTPANENASPSAEVSDAQIADTASRARILALASDAGLIQGDSGSYAVTITPFAWASLLAPDLRTNQSRYADAENLRRLTGKISGGGKGESFDRDGDGQADPALEAESFGDIVNYELAWRIGSRDPRDRKNVDQFERLMGKVAHDIGDMMEQTKRYNDALRQAEVNGDIARDQLNPDENAAHCRLALDAIRERASEFRAINAKIEAGRALYAQAGRRWAAAVDRSFLASIVASGTERDSQFGGDKRSLGFRASWGFVPHTIALGGEVCKTCSTGQTVDFSFDYIRNELPIGTDELEGFKLTARADAKFPQFPVFDWKDATLSASLAAEKYSDVPAGVEDTIAKASVGVSFKITDSIKIPFSITWANRTSLLAGEDEVVGHVGITYDLDALLGK